MSIEIENLVPDFVMNVIMLFEIFCTNSLSHDNLVHFLYPTYTVLSVILYRIFGETVYT